VIFIPDCKIIFSHRRHASGIKFNGRFFIPDFPAGFLKQLELTSQTMSGRTDPARPRTAPAETQPARKSVLIGVILGIALVAGIFLVLRSQKKPSVSGEAGPDRVATEVPISPNDPTISPPLPKHPSKPQAAQNVIQTALRPPTDLIAELETLSGTGGPISKEQADQMKQNLADLVRQGKASVPAIRAFLDKNVETYYADVPGGDQLGYSSLRSSLIDTLKQIGGPDSRAAMLQVLKTSAVPSELLEVAKNLDQDAPGQNRDEILNSATVALNMASSNQLGSNVEVGPAFRVLRNYGDANTIAEVEKSDPSSFYSAIALANLPDAQGLPTLVQMAQNGGGSSQTIATEMIAQLAGQNAQALDALTQMAQKGEIRNSTWMRLAPILAGDQYQIGVSPDQNPPSDGSSAGNLNYSMVNGAKTADQINQRVALIDKFLQMVPSGSAAAASLQHERGVLTGRLGN
jgi:hypothetical protein